MDIFPWKYVHGKKIYVFFLKECKGAENSAFHLEFSGKSMRFVSAGFYLI